MALRNGSKAAQKCGLQCTGQCLRSSDMQQLTVQLCQSQLGHALACQVSHDCTELIVWSEVRFSPRNTELALLRCPFSSAGGQECLHEAHVQHTVEACALLSSFPQSAVLIALQVW